METGGVIPIAKIVGVHGLRGTTRVYPYAEAEEIFSSDRKLWLRAADGTLTTVEVEWAKPHGRIILLSLKGVADRAQAEKLIDREIVIPKSSLPETEKDAYYWFDLIGLSVFGMDGVFLGRLEAVLSTGSNDVYIVAKSGEGGREEVLVPALKSVVIEVDLKKRRMRVNLPEGL